MSKIDTPVEDTAVELPRLKYLQPAQYLSWCRKVDDPDWVHHRYRDSKDNAMASSIRELRDGFSRIRELEKRLAEAERMLNKYGPEHGMPDDIAAFLSQGSEKTK